jgi:hypothetical protein
LADCCVFGAVFCLGLLLVTDDRLLRLLIQFLCEFNCRDEKPS